MSASASASSATCRRRRAVSTELIGTAKGEQPVRTDTKGQ
jgi:hypothetical protein